MLGYNRTYFFFWFIFCDLSGQAHAGTKLRTRVYHLHSIKPAPIALNEDRFICHLIIASGILGEQISWCGLYHEQKHSLTRFGKASSLLVCVTRFIRHFIASCQVILEFSAHLYR